MRAMINGVNLRLYFGLASPRPAPPEVMEALKNVQVTISAGEASGFQLSFSVGKRSKLYNKQLLDGFFDPSQRVIISVILKGSEHVLMDGVITDHEFNPSNEPGASTFTATGTDLSRLMDMVDLTGIPFPGIPVDGRVGIILAKYRSLGVVPKIIPSVSVADVPDPFGNWPVQKKTDLHYVKLLASEVGYVFYLEPGPRLGVSTAYWGPEIKTGKAQSVLVVNSDAANNASLSGVKFNGFGKSLLLAFVERCPIPLPVPVPDITPINPPLGRKLIAPLRVEQVHDISQKSLPQAAATLLAQAAQAADVISGSGKLDVLKFGRILQARQLVNLRGAPAPLNGSYYVTSVTHDIQPGRYSQSFSLSRNAFYPTQSALPNPVQASININKPLGSSLSIGETI